MVDVEAAAARFLFDLSAFASIQEGDAIGRPGPGLAELQLCRAHQQAKSVRLSIDDH